MADTKEQTVPENVTAEPEETPASQISSQLSAEQSGKDAQPTSETSAVREKRPLENADETTQGEKRQRTDDGSVVTSAARPAPTADILDQRFIVPNDRVGCIIGKGGVNTKRVRDEAGCNLSVVKEVDSRMMPDRIALLRGSPEAIARGARLMFEFIISTDRKDLPPPDRFTAKLLIHNVLVGAILGKSGSLIKETQAQCGVRMQIALELLPNSTEKMVSITGPLDAVERAVLRIMTQLRDSPMRLTSKVQYFQMAQYPMACQDAAITGLRPNGPPPPMGGPHYPPAPGYGGPPPPPLHAPPAWSGSSSAAGGGGYPPPAPSSPAGPPGVAPSAAAAGAGSSSSYPSSGRTYPGRPTHRLEPSSVIDPQVALSAIQSAMATRTGPPPRGDSIQRIVVPSITAGSIIGKGGMVVKEMRGATGCHVNIAAPEADTPDERIVTITGSPEGINMAIDVIRAIVDTYSPNSVRLTDQVPSQCVSSSLPARSSGAGGAGAGSYYYQQQQQQQQHYHQQQQQQPHYHQSHHQQQQQGYGSGAGAGAGYGSYYGSGAGAPAAPSASSSAATGYGAAAATAATATPSQASQYQGYGAAAASSYTPSAYGQQQSGGYGAQQGGYGQTPAQPASGYPPQSSYPAASGYSTPTASYPAQPAGTSAQAYGAAQASSYYGGYPTSSAPAAAGTAAAPAAAAGSAQAYGSYGAHSQYGGYSQPAAAAPAGGAPPAATGYSGYPGY